MSSALAAHHPQTPPHPEPQLEQICRRLALHDFCLLPAEQSRPLLQRFPGALADWTAFQDSWNHLQQDKFMADGGRYRKRLHATLSAEPSARQARAEAHRPHYQSKLYNPLNGGVPRHFEPIRNEILNGPTMQAALGLGCAVFGQLSPYTPWHIEAHQFRIETRNRQPGWPTPEGVHRDGVHFLMMMMVKRHNLVNGATELFNQEKQPLTSFTLTNPLDIALVNDERVLHGVTPISQLDPSRDGSRDVLLISFRRR
ncbi:2OG-Fe dioxygenase family protein [Chromobacterium piscinae]|uniref:2OG-Fe dioxygenase family protein n=2 Tax=Chromobacterium piscinae TaxID=686831 RepID=A0ABV0H099_9NEIS|nr:2OG-Fe dioxygenase family protein [Chromobacterium piscinae]MBX9299409.1 2OG-Fe dioxygenase family protein [Chromobacterium vaccinii]MBX9356191.1 2OG-Fe dioxygenase family protein [Chromobacterium vaccinii]MCD4506842.1 2OG-Fe dioxygenase family protein [Chromobacterium piscinae]MCD5326232.1 2OG-Fe dioxygenase family protein [Chromobacterium piscinae]NHQ80188.1 2OG-Fe dioxygenase family protein [Chromobacterium vaccinii]